MLCNVRSLPLPSFCSAAAIKSASRRERSFVSPSLLRFQNRKNSSYIIASCADEQKWNKTRSSENFSLDHKSAKTEFGSLRYRRCYGLLFQNANREYMQNSSSFRSLSPHARKEISPMLQSFLQRQMVERNKSPQARTYACSQLKYTTLSHTKLHNFPYLLQQSRFLHLAHLKNSRYHRLQPTLIYFPKRHLGSVPPNSENETKSSPTDTKNRNNHPSTSFSSENSSSSDTSNHDKDTTSPAQSQMQSFSTQLRSIPNMITLARIFSTPCLSYLIVTNQYTYALAGCTMAAFSDYLDGYIAKNYNATTVLGTYLDPLADKFIINVLALSLGYQEILPVWIVGMWFTRDIGLMATTYWWVRKHTDTSKGQVVIDPGRTPLQVHPTNISKVNTVLQFLTLFGGMGVGMMDGAGHEALLGLCYITAGTTVMSGLSYVGGTSLKMSSNLKKGAKVLKKEKDQTTK